MKYKITLTSAANEEIEAHAAYLRQFDRKVALKLYYASDDLCVMLRATPFVGTPGKFESPELHDLRMVLLPGFPDYLVFYRVMGNVVEILHFIHSAQDYHRILGP